MYTSLLLVFVAAYLNLFTFKLDYKNSLFPNVYEMIRLFLALLKEQNVSL